MRNCVFIATSIDGYIADHNGGLDWLDDIPNPNQNDMGYYQFYERMDALVMGRKTFEKRGKGRFAFDEFPISCFNEFCF